MVPYFHVSLSKKGVRVIASLKRRKSESHGKKVTPVASLLWHWRSVNGGQPPFRGRKFLLLNEAL